MTEVVAFNLAEHIGDIVEPRDKQIVLDEARQAIATYPGQLAIKGRLLDGCTSLTDVVTQATDAVLGMRSFAAEMRGDAESAEGEATAFKDSFTRIHDDHRGPIQEFSSFVIWADTIRREANRLTDDITTAGNKLQSLVQTDFPGIDTTAESLRRQKTDLQKAVEVAEKLVASSGADCTVPLTMHLNGQLEQLQTIRSQHQAAEDEVTDIIGDINDTKDQYSEARNALGALEARFMREKEARIADLQTVIDAYHRAITEVIEGYRETVAKRLQGIEGLFESFCPAEPEPVPETTPPLTPSSVPEFSSQSNTQSVSVTFAYGIRKDGQTEDQQ